MTSLSSDTSFSSSPNRLFMARWAATAVAFWSISSSGATSMGISPSSVSSFTPSSSITPVSTFTTRMSSTPSIQASSVSLALQNCSELTRESFNRTYVCFARGVDGLLQFGRVHFDVLAEGFAGLCQVEAGLRRPANDHQLSGLHLINNLLDGVAIRATFVVYHLLSGVVDEVAGQSSRCGAVGQDDRVFGVLAPLDEEFSGEAGLEVRLAAKHHLRAGHPGQVCQTVAQRQSERVGSQPGILCSPNLVQQLSQLQHTARCIHGDQDITVTTKSLHYIGCETGGGEDKNTKGTQHYRLCTVGRVQCPLPGERRAEGHEEQTMVNFVSLAREHWVNILVPMGFVFGWYLDRLQDTKLTAFRNKSLLFGRELKPGEEVTWK
ncbi:hypothetical protein F7725_019781 [Dissostichus mawsoni]|uniref:NADH dehydrogenase [ubiquinone] 1 beta subcomplex subunit 1 n=2 Tax=Nototheniidae TaxID=8206 RepID=A0A7J5YKP1_DISMA|nr:hypothetical protein F7725_019781 [Dissostichus mawsoni]